jgi:hypothetical protein
VTLKAFIKKTATYSKIKPETGCFRGSQEEGTERGTGLKSVPGKELKRRARQTHPRNEKRDRLKSVPFLLKPTTIYFNQLS